jgi:hypothetical protein
MAEKQSYLATVKADMETLVDECVDEEADPTEVKKRLWTFMEGKLKESYKNGRASSTRPTNSRGESTPTERRPAFRRS